MKVWQYYYRVVTQCDITIASVTLVTEINKSRSWVEDSSSEGEFEEDEFDEAYNWIYECILMIHW